MSYPKWYYSEEFPKGKLFQTETEFYGFDAKAEWVESPADIGTKPKAKKKAAETETKTIEVETTELGAE